MFDTAIDAAQKLKGTIILLNETPIWVVGANDCGNLGKTWVTLKYWTLPNMDKIPEVLECKLDEKHVDFRSLGSRLGYMNAIAPGGDTQAIFVSRMAKRQTVQGLNQTNISFNSFITEEGKVEPLFHNFFKQPFFSDMLKGKYPSMKTATKLILDEASTSVAFARWFAFKKKKVGPYYLEYKGKEIGWSPDLKEINLSEAYTHLQETLEYYDIPFKLTAT